MEQILKQAQESDERIRTGNCKSLLDGIPVTIKANIAVGRYWEMPNACSAILSQDQHADDISCNSGKVQCSTSNHVYESDIARLLLKNCGAVLIGITNMDEFGMGSLGINNGLHKGGQHTKFSPTYNPIPWMQRLASLLGCDQYQFDKKSVNDEYWLEKILNSTPENPHGVYDENCLADLLDEVQSTICGIGTNDINSVTDEFPLLSPGGSSSGAAASVGHGSSLLSIGTDTGGSIRLPSAWTSTIGFKPSYGTFSRYGVVSYVSSLDTVGFVTGTTECAEIAWRCLVSKNTSTCVRGVGVWNAQVSRDSTARVYHKENRIGNQGAQLHCKPAHHTLFVDESMSLSDGPLADIRVGIPSAFSLNGISPIIANTWSETARILQNVGGATLVSIAESKLPSEWIRLALASYYVLACAEASSNLSRYDGLRYGMNVNLDTQHSEQDVDLSPLCGMTALEQQISSNRVHGFGGETQRRILAGTSVLSSDRFHTHYEAASVVRAKIAQSLESAFRSNLNDEHDDDDKVDVMLVPTALSFPPKLNPIKGDRIHLVDPTAAFANDVMTIPISLGGFPSISVPVNANDMMGMQIFAAKGREDLVLRVANALQ